MERQSQHRDQTAERIKRNEDDGKKFLEKVRDFKEQLAAIPPTAEAVIEAQKYTEHFRSWLGNTLIHIQQSMDARRSIKEMMNLDYTCSVKRHDLLQEPQNHKIFLDAIDSVLKEAGLDKVLHAVVMRQTYLPKEKGTFGADDLQTSYTMGIQWDLESI